MGGAWKRPHLFWTIALAGLALPGCSRFKERTVELMQQSGIQERDDRNAMLNSERPLPPPRDTLPPIATFAAPAGPVDTGADVETDALPALVVQLAEKQDALASEQKKLRTDLTKRGDTLAQQAKEQKDASAEQIKALDAKIDQRVKGLEDRVTKLEERPSPPVAPNAVPQVSVTPPDPVKLPETQVSLPPVKLPAAPEPEAQPEVAQAAPEPAPAPQPPALRSADSYPPRRPPERAARKPEVFSAEAQRHRAEARSALERIAEELPDSNAAVEALQKLSQLDLEDAQVTVARQRLEKVLERPLPAARSAPLHAQAAELCEELGDYDAARRHWLEFVDRLPNDRRVPDALLAVAGDLEAVGRHEEAFAHYQDISRRYETMDTGMEARRRKADLLFYLERYERAAEDYLSLAEKLVPGRDDFQYGLLQATHCMLKLDRALDARKHLDKLLSNHPTEDVAGEAMWLFAQTYDRERRYLDAARAFMQAADRFPRHPREPEEREEAARRFASLGLHQRAVEQYGESLQGVARKDAAGRAQAEPRVRLGLIRSLRALGKGEDARREIETLKSAWPNDPVTAQLALEEVELLVAKGQTDAARSELEKIVDRTPGSPLALRALIRKAELEERFLLSKDAAETYARLDGRITEAETAAAFEFRRAVFLMNEGRDAEALPILDALRDQEQVPARYRMLASFQRGMALERMGNFPEATKAYQAALKTGESRPEAFTDKDELLKASRWKLEKLEWLQRVSQAPANAAAPR
ncbi:MAG: hypothetical protein AMXMBFR7_30870 [Planctomycetota bacterium]